MSGVLKVWRDIWKSSNAGVERGHAWFTANSKGLVSFFKKIDGCGFACAVIDGDVQKDDLVGIPGSIDLDGKELGANPLAGDGDV